MERQNNKVAISVMATLASGIALIYTLIIFPQIIFAVAGISIVFLVSAFILTQNIIAFIHQNQKTSDSQIDACMKQLSSHMEAMHGAQSQIAKANYLYTRKIAQTITTLENNYTESQEVLYKNLSSLSVAQNKATKLMIKYDQDNTTKVISTLKDLRNQLSDTMIQGFDQIQPNNTEMVTALEDIVNYLKSQPGSMDPNMGLQLNNVAHELQNISNSIQRVQIPMAGIAQPVMMQQPPMANAPQQTEPTVSEPTDTTSPIIEDTPAMDIPIATVTENTPAMETPIASIEEDTIVEAPLESIPEETIDQMIAETIAEESADLSTEESFDLPEEPFTPTFTVVGKSDETAQISDSEPVKEEPVAETPVSEPVQVEPVSDDPNKQLSADEIAALFAAAEPSPKKEEPVAETPAPEPVKVEPISDDPNKQLSADEIAALFAAAEPSPKKEEPVAETPAPEPVKVEPIFDDPNKQLSPDEIAALFASLG